MKKRLLAIILTLAVCCPLLNAQGKNPYEIDDDCYVLYRRAELSVGEPSFQATADSLVALSRSIGDGKAETLAHVLILKHTINGGNYDDILANRAELAQIAQQKGYMQYYFYSYQLVATYIYNKRSHTEGIQWVQSMIDEAKRLNSEYGQFSGNQYLAKIYESQFDYVNCRSCLREQLRIYNSSTDETVRRQSINPVYSNMAQSFRPGSDSAAFYINKAAESSITLYDSINVNYLWAIYNAARGNVSEYKRYRALITPHIKDVSRRYLIAPKFIAKTDSIFSGVHLDMKEFAGNCKYETYRYLSEVFYNQNRFEEAFLVSRLGSEYLSWNYSEENHGMLETANAELGNVTLTAKLLRQTRNILWIVILSAVIIFGIVLFSYIKLRRAKKRAEEANEMKSRFVQNMSHDVRTPLNAIVGFSQLLSLPDGFLTEAEKNEYAGYVRNNSDMLTMLINDTLDLSDMDHDHFMVNIESFSCNQVCRNTMKCVEGRIPEGVEFRFDTEVEDDYMLTSDPMRLQQVLTNYLTNAFKHTKSGSVVLSCSLSENPENVTFAVTDTGEGVPPEKAEVIFQRFTKLNEFVAGSGLGLNIVALIAGKLGATAKLDTSYTGGARFLFIIPVNGMNKETI